MPSPVSRFSLALLLVLLCPLPLQAVESSSNASGPTGPTGMEEVAHPRVMIQRAERFLALGKTDAAIHWYRKVLDCCEGTADAAEAHNDLGVAYSRKGLDDDALREYEASLAINAYPLARFNLGKALLRRAEVLPGVQEGAALRERALGELRLFQAYLESGRDLPPVAASQREEIEAYLFEVLGKSAM